VRFSCAASTGILRYVSTGTPAQVCCQTAAGKKIATENGGRRTLKARFAVRFIFKNTSLYFPDKLQLSRNKKH
jgi:hypothetical protein